MAQSALVVLAVILAQVRGWFHHIEQFQVYCIVERGLEALGQVVEGGKENLGQCSVVVILVKGCICSQSPVVMADQVGGSHH